jgi:CPA1 family monovalent cation:H+ antiporter
MENGLTCLTLLALLALSGVISRRLSLPLRFVQIGLGALAGWPARGIHVGFDPDLFLLLFIPPLLFADAWRLPKQVLLRHGRTILMLALGLVFFTVAGVGYFVHWLVPIIPLPAAFALAAVLSPTDAVALGAMTTRVRMPRAMAHILGGEALLNDASSLISFKFAVAAAFTGSFSFGEAATTFLLIAIGGLAVGIGVAYGFNWFFDRAMTRRESGTATDSLLLLLLPFAAYLLADRIGVSGILSVVAAGMTMDWIGFLERSPPAMRMEGHFVWGMMEYVFNGIIFLLLGLYLPVALAQAAGTSGILGHHAAYLLMLAMLITVALIVLRFVWISATMPIEVWFRRRDPQWRWPGIRAMIAASLGGPRGAISLAAILSLPQTTPLGGPFPARDLLIALAVGVILCSLLTGAVGLPLALRGIFRPELDAPEEGRWQAQLAAAEAAIRAVEERQR